MKIGQLLHFEALYRLRSFADAAREQDVTQSGLSRSIQKLEIVVGGRLFDRTTHAVEPTDLGEGLIQSARNVVEAVLALEEEAERLKGSETGHVRIGAGPYPAQPLITSTIASVAAQHPGIQVSVVAGTANDLLAALLRRELEFVVADLSKYEDSPAAGELEVIPLPSEPLAIVMSPDHALAKVDWQVSELAEHAWAMPTISPVGRRELPSFFGTKLVPDHFPLFRLETTAACLELAKTGHAVTMVPKSLATRACQTGELVAHTAGPSMRTNDGIHLVKRRSRSPATRLFIEQIKQTARSLANELEPYRDRAKAKR